MSAPPYIDNERSLDPRSCARGVREAVGTKASAATSQLRSFRVFLAVVSYRKWGLKVIGVSRAFLKSQPAGRWVYEGAPLFTRRGQGARCRLLKPLRGLPTASKEWYETSGVSNKSGTGGGPLLDKSDFLHGGGSFDYGFGKGVRDKCIGG